MTVLPDTSIWIDFFRGREPAAEELDHILAREPVVYCGPILSELLAGTPPNLRPTLWLAFGGLVFVDLGFDDWREAGEVAHDLRLAGRTVPLLDVLIAIATVRAGAAIWTRDADFRRIAEVMPALRLHGEG